MTKAIEVALFLHLLGVAVWIGGMVFAHFCLRPALGDLTPQMRLPLWEASDATKKQIELFMAPAGAPFAV